jgi:phosphate-selective porin
MKPAVHKAWQPGNHPFKDKNNMRKKINLCGIFFVLASSIVYAEAEFDFETLMESIDNNSHNLQGNIATKDANATIALAKQMQSDFKLVEGFFEKRGNAADAVTDAKKYEDMAAEIVKFVEANDFDSASNKAIEISNSCDDACHDTYKPL